MSKFNLKQILVKDYEVDLVRATNFEQWIGKNMDYEAVMEKNFRDVSFKSSKTNKKDFLKDLKYRALKLDPIQSIKDILNLFEENENKTNIELYDKIRKLELELKETKEKIDTQSKRILELKAEKKDEYLMVLKPLLEKFGLNIGEKNITPGTKGVRDKFIEDLTFVSKNRAFVNACIKFKNAQLVPVAENSTKVQEKKISPTLDEKPFVKTIMPEGKLEFLSKAKEEEQDKEWHNITARDLKELGEVFYQYSTNFTGKGYKDHKNYFVSSVRSNYNTSSIRECATHLGIKTKIGDNGRLFLEVTPNQFVIIFNTKTPKKNQFGESI